ncbi:MAG: hypothetical protein IKX40_14310 [Thermoguttaceae bacterium]|nr:hypothetical protein [Thermoguttaceae bacterium]
MSLTNVFFILIGCFIILCALLVLSVLFGPLAIILYIIYFKRLNTFFRIAFLFLIAFQLYSLVYLINYNQNESPFFVGGEFGTTNLHRSFFSYSDKDIDRLLTLIRKGADVNAQDNAGNTPLHRQMKYFDGYRPSQILIDNGSDMNIQNHQGKTPIRLLIESLENKLRHNEIENSMPCIKEGLRLIASNKFDANIKDDCGASVFDSIVGSSAIKLCPEAVHEITIKDGSLSVPTFAYNSSGELIYCKDSTGKTVYSKENSEDSSPPTECNAIDDLRQAINQNNYTIEYQLLGFEPLPKSEPIYKNPKDRPKPFWVDKFINAFPRPEL